MSGVYKFLVVVFMCCAPIIDCNDTNDSPCPEILSYMRHPITNEIFARIRISSPPKNFRQLTLKVLYQTREDLQNDNRGWINLRWPLAKTMEKIIHNESLVFIVHFPLLPTVPQIVFISLDDVPLCVTVAQDPVANIFGLKYYLSAPQSDGASPHTISTSEALPTTETPTKTSTTVAPPVIKKKNVIFLREELNELSEGCGRINSDDDFKFDDNVRLRPGQWPWMAAIYITNSSYQFHCTGTLISDRHILTAAHCTFDENRQLAPNLFVVSLGRYQIDDWNEPLSDTYEVSSIHVHPDYKFGETSVADLAIIELSKRVRFKMTVRHLCIQMDFRREFGPVEELGYVAGWGDKTPASEEEQEIVNKSSEAKLHVVPIISPKKCKNKTHKLKEFITDNNFCARSQNGVSGPCKGDGGAALAVAVFEKFYLRGVVSMSAVDKTARNCDHKDFVVYVDVFPYTRWILRKVLFKN